MTLKAYTDSVENVLANLYSKIEADLTEFYRFINLEDEAGFTAKLEHSAGKLDLDVDFYGRGFFPPGAYHSEGHQDGMGLCMYLALKSEMSGANFTLAILDDVVMSVDKEHRREVCRLLLEKFPSTQIHHYHPRRGVVSTNASTRFGQARIYLEPSELVG